MPPGAVIGTSSLRRESQIRARYPQLQVRALRGNVETRLRKLDEGGYQAVVLAAAGLMRLGLQGRIRRLLSAEESVPAIGQGALGIEFLRRREDLKPLLQPLCNSATTACITAERAFGRRLGANCEVPLGAYAEIRQDAITLTGLVAAIDASAVLRTTATGAMEAAARIGAECAEQLLQQGADRLMVRQ